MPTSDNTFVLASGTVLFGIAVIPPSEAVTIGQIMVAGAAGPAGAAGVFAAIGRYCGHQGSREEVGNCIDLLKANKQRYKVRN